MEINFISFQEKTYKWLATSKSLQKHNGEIWLYDFGDYNGMLMYPSEKWVFYKIQSRVLDTTDNSIIETRYYENIDQPYQSYSCEKYDAFISTNTIIIPGWTIMLM